MLLISTLPDVGTTVDLVIPVQTTRTQPGAHVAIVPPNSPSEP